MITDCEINKIIKLNKYCKGRGYMFIFICEADECMNEEQQRNSVNPLMAFTQINIFKQMRAANDKSTGIAITDIWMI